MGWTFVVGFLFTGAVVWAGDLPGSVSDEAGDGRMALVAPGCLVPVYAEAEDHEVVRVAAGDLVADIERVTGQKPALTLGRIDQELRRRPLPAAIIVGSLDRSAVVGGLVKSGKLDVSGVAGQWEAFTLQVVKNPLPGVAEALVIAGSDRRGTAYGVYELSRRIGVSPWYWWADVVPEKKAQLHWAKLPLKVGPPGVKYRGIFINDEMWALRPWAEGTFAPEEGRGLGPKTYAKVFELLLRLRANYIWPAMHQQTKAFHLYEGNKLVADRYGIVMGGSHTEVMLRNNMHGAEWDVEHGGDGGEWNYMTQPQKIQDYWIRGVKQWGMYENLYNVGMRGRDDAPMIGPADVGSRIRLMEKIFQDQRDIIAKHVNPDAKKVPQTLVAYSEVVDLYDKGMKVPDDVTMTWPEDNFGYIRRLPTLEEQQRSGGSGIYYHLQWINGATGAYAWLNTMPPSLIFAEMNKAWQYRCKQIWVLNVGDIKPGEIGLDFFMEMAWNPDRFTHDNIGGYLEQWAARDLSAEHAAEIAGIMKRYYQLAMGRRPEHLVMHAGNVPLMFDWFSHEVYNDEAALRMAAYVDIQQRSEALYEKMPDERKAAFYQLVLYPVKGASLMNQKVIHASRSLHDAASGRSTARVHAQHARAALEDIILITDVYNNAMPGGVGAKWRHLMHWAPGPWGGQRHQYEMPPLSDYMGLGRPNLLVIPEGEDKTEGMYPVGRKVIDDLSVYTRTKRFIDLFNIGKDEITWKAEVSPDWLKLDQSAGTFSTGLRLWVDVDWDNAPKSEKLSGMITITSNGGSHTLEVPVFNPAAPAREQVNGHVESHGYVCMEAEHHSRASARDGVEWKAVDNLGRSGDSVIPVPSTGPSFTTPAEIAAHSPVMEYDFHIFSSGEFELHFDCLPTYPVGPGRGTRLAFSLDDGPIKIAGEGVEQKPTPGAGKGQAAWNKLLNLRRINDVLKVAEPGAHTLKVWMVDPGVILDRIAIHTAEPKVSYFGPPESFFGKAEN